MKTFVNAALMASALLISSVTFAQVSETSFAETLQQQVHVTCHVTKGPRAATINEIELTVTNSQAKVAVSYEKPDHSRITKTFSNRDWSVTESYDDYSNQTQYEALVNLTDDNQNFLLVQFYSNKADARGVLQIGAEAYDLLCK